MDDFGVPPWLRKKPPSLTRSDQNWDHRSLWESVSAHHIQTNAIRALDLPHSPRSTSKIFVFLDMSVFFCVWTCLTMGLFLNYTGESSFSSLKWSFIGGSWLPWTGTRFQFLGQWLPTFEASRAWRSSRERERQKNRHVTCIYIYYISIYHHISLYIIIYYHILVYIIVYY